MSDIDPGEFRKAYQRHHPAKIALLAQIVLFSFVYLCSPLLDMGGGEFKVRHYLWFPLIIWHCMMLGFWAAFGNARWRWLVIVTACPLIGYWAAIATGSRDRALIEFQIFCLTIITVVALSTAVLRAWQGKLQILPQHERRPAGAWQFTIGRLLVWTTALAVLLATGRLLVQSLDFTAVGTSHTVRLIAMSGSISGAALISIWVCLGERVTLPKIMTLLLAFILSGFVIYWSYFMDYFLVIASSSAQVCFLVTLGLLRARGWRCSHTARAGV